MLRRKRIGDHLVEKGLIRREWDSVIVEYGKLNGLKFGEAAVELDLISSGELRQALIYPFGKERFFDLRKLEMAPEALKLFSVADMIRHGVVPLGFHRPALKLFRRVLRVGVLRPVSLETKKWLEAHYKNLGPFEWVDILGDQLLEFWKNHNHVDPNCILSLACHPWFKRYLSLNLKDVRPEKHQEQKAA